MTPTDRVRTGFRLSGFVGGLLAIVLAVLCAVAVPPAAPVAAQDGSGHAGTAPTDSERLDLAPAQPAVVGGKCLDCHRGVEDAHPWAPVTCVQCHGGNAEATKKEDAHVAASARAPGDERVLPQGHDPERTRFLDPGNLRIAHLSCGPCHARAVEDTLHSLHATTAGHLADGLYENGVTGEKHPGVSVFAVRDSLPDDAKRPEGAVAALRQIGSFATGGDRTKLSTHFTDLPRKACMQCHLWSRGRAVRGRAGMDGDYRGEGCTACHMPYADDGISQSKDPTVDKFEPGHPRVHRMVRFPPTDVCVRCHYGDASIGLSFRGLAQPVPGMPQTPDAPGLHRKRMNGVYYIDDPGATPADVHHQRGMHCVDCHTRNDVMGDGFLYKRMEDAVEIKCETCHGNDRGYATGLTRKGTKLPHLIEQPDGIFLRSRVTGKLHRVKQARDVVRPGSPDYNPAAAAAMNDDHGRVGCHGCHSSWNPNFFGFHFDRNEAFTQLDLLSGQRTAGRVTTQEKVFSTFKSFYMGWDSHGRVAPYMVGFSSMATVHGKDGELLLDQELPVTRAGLSGMTMIHHQTHTTSSRARQCVECHRSPQALGRGSVNFRLAREIALAAADTGVSVIVVDRKTPANTATLSFVAIPGVRAVATVPDRLSGRASWGLAASATEGLVVLDLTAPAFAKDTNRVRDSLTDPRAILVAASRAYVADGEAGVKVFDLSTPLQPRLRATVKVPAYGLHLDGPHLFVAAGAKGLAVLDVRNPDAARVLVEQVDLNGSDTSPFEARAVSVMFQYSRPNQDVLEGPRTRARNLAAVATTTGIYLLDVTEPGQPRTVSRIPAAPVGGFQFTDVALATIYELGSEGGAIPSRERDVVLTTATAPQPALGIFDITDPTSPQYAGHVDLRAGVRTLRVFRVYNAPFAQTYALTGDPAGAQLVDLTRPSKPVVAAAVANTANVFDLDVEEFPLDRAVDADGKPILDVSHEGARWPSQEEFLRILGAPIIDMTSPGGTR